MTGDSGCLLRHSLFLSLSLPPSVSRSPSSFFGCVSQTSVRHPGLPSSSPHQKGIVGGVRLARDSTPWLKKPSHFGVKALAEQRHKQPPKKQSFLWKHFWFFLFRFFRRRQEPESLGFGGYQPKQLSRYSPGLWSLSHPRTLPVWTNGPQYNTPSNPPPHLHKVFSVSSSSTMPSLDSSPLIRIHHRHRSMHRRPWQHAHTQNTRACTLKSQQ